MNSLISEYESNAIRIIRTLAMLSIVTCHFLQAYANNLCWTFNIGVQIFFVLSGYLYGHKDVDNWPRWFINRFIKIFIPVYIYTTI